MKLKILSILLLLVSSTSKSTEITCLNDTYGNLTTLNMIFNSQKKIGNVIIRKDKDGDIQVLHYKILAINSSSSGTIFDLVGVNGKHIKFTTFAVAAEERRYGILSGQFPIYFQCFRPR